MTTNVISGFASIKINNHWIGVIAGNIYCDKARLSSNKALQDARKKYNKVYN